MFLPCLGLRSVSKVLTVCNEKSGLSVGPGNPVVWDDVFRLGPIDVGGVKGPGIIPPLEAESSGLLLQAKWAYYDTTNANNNHHRVPVITATTCYVLTRRHSKCFFLY